LHRVFQRGARSCRRQDAAGGFIRSGGAGNRFTDDVASLKDLIMDAYNVKPHQVAGLPEWGVRGERTPTLAEVRRMLQIVAGGPVPIDAASRDPRTLRVCAGGRQKEHGKPPVLTCPAGDGVGGRGGGRIPEEEVAFLRSWERMMPFLAGWAGRPVIDKTGLEGQYCTLDGHDPLTAVVAAMHPGQGRRKRAGPPADAATSAGDDSAPTSIFTLVEKKWGLRLEPQKGPVDVLAIDRIERPSAN
jgi:hypothetical protein